MQLDERAAVGDVPVYRQNGPRSGFHVDHVVVVAPVLVGILERAPPGGEGEPASLADQVPQVRHRASIPRIPGPRPELLSPTPGPMDVRWHDDPDAH